ncbi:MAG: MlaE family ABC transporter permease, partial [Pseudomonadota bacterium]
AGADAVELREQLAQPQHAAGAQHGPEREQLRAHALQQRAQRAPQPPAGLGGAGATLRIDAGALAAWDADLAPALWPLLAPLARRGVVLDLSGLPEPARAALALALPRPAETAPAEPEPEARRWRGRGGLRSLLQFVGEVLLALGAVLRGRGVLRLRELLAQLDRVGPGSLPIVTLTVFLAGLLLAYVGGSQLDRIGAGEYIAQVVTVGVVREMAAIMTGIILAGRLGAAFAAELASMQASEEIDALRTLGVDPVAHLVLPRLLAAVAMAPLLVLYAMAVGVLAGMLPTVGVYRIGAAEYLHGAREAFTWTHLWIGLAKGTLYLALVALAGCREGLRAGRSAQAVGEATTRAVVRALVWIVAAACASTVVLTWLGY